MLGFFRIFRQTPFIPTHRPVSFQTIPVRQSMFDASIDDNYSLVFEVTKFVNALNDVGKIRGDEVPKVAIQSCHADLYLCQVSNGGHKQFIQNSGADFNVTATNALAGLKAMGAEQHAELLEDLLSLAAEMSEEAFGSQSLDALDVLDYEFFALEKTTSLVDRNANWIRSWKMLLVVNDENYQQVVSDICDLEPKSDLGPKACAIGA